MSNEVKKVSDLISSLFNNLSTPEMQQANSFVKSWKEIVGEKIAAHSTVIDVDRGTVIIEVDHPGWSQQILFKKKQIVWGLSRSYPELKITNVIMRVVTECKTPYIKQNESVGAGVTRVEDAVCESEFPMEMNEELKTVLERLKKSIKKGKSVT